MPTPRKLFYGGIVVVALVLAGTYWSWAGLWVPMYQKLAGQRTVADVLERYGPAAQERLRPHFEAAGVPFPPKEIALLAFKDARRLELYADTGGRWVRVRDYEVLRASGGAGPKLREGDRQVPEGLYALEGLNPNSRHHVSMKVSYPNEYDRAMAQRDGRTDLGGDIFVHGGASSIGCLAMGDEAAEELFVLSASIGYENVRLVIAPTDFRKNDASPPPGAPPWVPELYARLRAEVRSFERAR